MTANDILLLVLTVLAMIALAVISCEIQKYWSNK